jgi:hypothetical protein
VDLSLPHPVVLPIDCTRDLQCSKLIYWSKNIFTFSISFKVVSFFAHLQTRFAKKFYYDPIKKLYADLKFV